MDRTAVLHHFCREVLQSTVNATKHMILPESFTCNIVLGWDIIPFTQAKEVHWVILGLYWDYIGGYIGVILGIMENKMETTIVDWGYRAYRSQATLPLLALLMLRNALAADILDMASLDTMPRWLFTGKAEPEPRK